MTRLFLIVVMIAICLGAGATAGPAAFASELSWPLSEANLTASLALGTGWGVVGALVAAVALALADRKRLGITAVIAVAVTWLISFAGVWWVVVSSLG
jgi:hypothetical protein